MKTTNIEKITLPITGIYKNLTFSSKEVWSWYTISVPKDEFGVYPEEAGVPPYLRAQLQELLQLVGVDELKFQMFISSNEQHSIPTVVVGVNLGERKEGEDPVVPKIVDKFINFVADAPVSDYIAQNELNYWEDKSTSYNKYFGATSGFKVASSSQLIYLVRKRFYPGMPVTPLVEDKEIWGEGEILPLANTSIQIHPKYLSLTQKIDNNVITGYRASLELIKQSTEISYPEFESWLPYIASFPYPVDFSIRFTVSKDHLVPVTKTTLIIETIDLDTLNNRMVDLQTHYQENGIQAIWTSGDQFSLFNESIPSGFNIDEVNRKKTSELTATNIIEYLSFSKTDVYTWVTLPLSQIEFLDDTSKLSLVHTMNNAFGSLLSSEEKNVECHILIQGTPFDARTWVKKLHSVYQPHDPQSGYRDYLTQMYNHVESSDYRTRTVLVGINLGSRLNYAPNKANIHTSPTLVETVLNLIPTPVADTVTDKELEYWRSIARPYMVTLKTLLDASPATATEIAFSIRKNFFPEMPLPTPQEIAVGFDDQRWDEEDLAYLADGSIENHPKYVKITQTVDGVEVEGYRATLCVSRFPETLFYPEGDPWVHVASILPFPVDFSLRFTIEPSRKVRKEVGKKRQGYIDQIINMESAGGARTTEINENFLMSEDLDYELKRDPVPWIYGRYRLIVEAATLQELKDRVRQVADHYRQLDINIAWPTGDQLSLLKESLPNDRVRLKSYYHRHMISILSAAVIAGTGTAGDNLVVDDRGGISGWIGSYRGYTIGQTNEPWFYDMHSTIATNHGNGVSITGSPGGGKTNFALSLAYESALSGAWTIIIDPKADARSLVNAPGITNVKTYDLRTGHPGLLNPFSLGSSKAEQKNRALEVLYIFLGGINSVTAEEQTQIAQAVNVVAEARPNPTLMDVVRFLEGNRISRNIGSKISVLAELPFSQLCFSPSSSTQRISPEDGLTIFTLEDLKLPASGAEAENNSERLGMGVMYLLVEYTMQLLQHGNKRHPKTIIIDEAWAIMGTKQGDELIKRGARMGRAYNTALVLISQNATDFMGEGVSNSISTRFTFRTDEEQPETLKYLNMEVSDSNVKLLASLKAGQCIVKDWSGRIAHAQVENWNMELADAVDTNPASKKA